MQNRLHCKHSFLISLLCLIFSFNSQNVSADHHPDHSGAIRYDSLGGCRSVNSPELFDVGVAKETCLAEMLLTCFQAPNCSPPEKNPVAEFSEPMHTTAIRNDFSNIPYILSTDVYTIALRNADSIFEPKELLHHGRFAHRECIDPPGWVYNAFGLCVDTNEPLFVPEKNQGSCSQCKGNPINHGTGNKYQIEVDYTATGSFPLLFSRTYNSYGFTRTGSIGEHWRHNYDQSITILYASLMPSAHRAKAIRADGKLFRFTPDTANGLWNADDPDVIETLEELVDGLGNRTGWRYTTSNDTVEIYDANGKLISLTNRAGFTQILDYELTAIEGGDDISTTLDRVTDHFGRTLIFTYGTNGFVNSMTDAGGKIYNYSYDANNNLSTVTYPDETPGDSNDNPTRVYHYEKDIYVHALTGITNENGVRFASWGYDAKGRAEFSEHANGVERVDIVYNADGTVTTTDALGQVQTYHFEIHHGVVKTSQIDGGPCTNCGNQFQNIIYDANGFVASRTDFNGNVTTFINDARGLQTSRTEAVGTLDERTITTEWHVDFRLPIKITEPGRITDFTYDTQGRLLERKVTKN